MDSSDAIPFDRLPPGFVETLDHPPDEPVVPRPAATVVLMRQARRTGLEVLLLRRVRSSGFVPGAWVFPGGRVDADDASPELVERTADLTPAGAAAALGMPAGAEPAAIAYVIAALREAFEETGLLLAVRDSGSPVPSAAEDATLAHMRRRLLADDDLFAPLLAEHDLHLDGGAVAYLAHWITPVVEPRRYDARFFAAAVEGGGELLLNEAEMSAARWETPEGALELHASGELPMVFPTVKTLESLVGFESPRAALEGLASRRVPSWLPRLIRTPEGVAMELEEV